MYVYDMNEYVDEQRPYLNALINISWEYLAIHQITRVGNSLQVWNPLIWVWILTIVDWSKSQSIMWLAGGRKTFDTTSKFLVIRPRKLLR